MKEEFSSWTIYDHPLDYPDFYVARRFRLDRGPDPIPTLEVRLNTDLEQLRAVFRERGLYCFPRAPSDEPQIVETWL